MLLFNLAHKIRTNNNIRGIVIHGEECKGAQYADDFWLTLIATKGNKDNAMMELNEFAKFSGLKTNFSKTVVLPIGRLANRAFKINTDFPLSWTDQAIKIQGIHIHTDRSIMSKLNYSPLLQKMRETIMMWRYRSLTILGKIQFVNSLITSQFV